MGRAYWRSLEERSESPEFQEKLASEFPQLAEALQDPKTRRDFLKVMAASLGMMGLASCRWPKETILPFAGRPEGRIPGVPQQFATAMSLFGNVLGLLVTSFDGRPTKVEGNPLHPESQGGAHMWAQAAVLELYDPDRSQVVVQREAGQRVVSSWENFKGWFGPVLQELARGRGQGLWVLGDGIPSPTRKRLQEQLSVKFPQVRWVEWDPLARGNEERGLELATARSASSHLCLEQARVVVDIADDLFLKHPQGVANARGYAQGRRDLNDPLRLYVAEPVPTITGAVADWRLAARPERLSLLVLGLAHELVRQGLLLPISLPPLPALSEEEAAWVKAAARDLRKAGNKGLFVVGPNLPPAAHALGFVINRFLGAVGSTVRYFPSHNFAGELPELRSALEEGKVRLLLVLGGNPAVSAVPELAPEVSFPKAGAVVRLGLYEDETSRLAHWHIPQAHFLESWGDLVSQSGIYSVVQPLIAPLFGGKTAEEILSLMLEGERDAYELVRETFQVKGGDEVGWRRTLHDGLAPNTGYEPLKLEVAKTEWIGQLAAFEGNRLSAWVVPDAKLLDGRFANNAWLQELPEPITKLTWGNALLVNPETAAQYRLRTGDLVRLRVVGGEIVVPAFILPGVAANTVGLVSGYGRRGAGRVGDGVGSDVAAFLGVSGTHAVVSLEPTGARGEVVSTQDQQAIDHLGLEALGHRLGELIRQVTPKNPEVPGAGSARPPMPWEERPFTGEYQWAMVVDLAACIGCGACVVACQAENNIPVVGAKQVARGRQMHWLRIDRYFSGPPEKPEFAFQPVMCQHCENAPCEQVCPVAATVHSEEGLNQMVYNRCVGTRYCSNNCPYKVRRFNYFNYFKQVSELRKLAFNPEVTIRGRGVMEKCSFCIQRIEAAKISARNQGRALRDGDVVPACAQTCPAQAISFGNQADPDSQVARWQKDKRAYQILTELNTRPRVTYLAQVRNAPEEA